MVEIERTLGDLLADDCSIVVVVLYGSAAHGGLTPHSDVDVAVTGRGPLSVEERAALALRLERGLRRSVDLVDLRSLAGTILHQVLTKGVVVKNADPALLAFFIKKSLYHRADMQPLLERMLLARARRFAYGQVPRSDKAPEPCQVRRSH